MFPRSFVRVSVVGLCITLILVTFNYRTQLSTWSPYADYQDRKYDARVRDIFNETLGVRLCTATGPRNLQCQADLHSAVPGDFHDFDARQNR